MSPGLQDRWFSFSFSKTAHEKWDKVIAPKFSGNFWELHNCIKMSYTTWHRPRINVSTCNVRYWWGLEKWRSGSLPRLREKWFLKNSVHNTNPQYLFYAAYYGGHLYGCLVVSSIHSFIQDTLSGKYCLPLCCYLLGMQWDNWLLTFIVFILKCHCKVNKKSWKRETYRITEEKSIMGNYIR